MARISVHEPDPETRRLLSLLVTRLGHDVVDRNADLILVEPVEDGPGAVGLARAENPGAPVIVCSIARHDREALAALHANGYLLKPFGLAELRDAIAGAQAPAAI